MNQANYFQVSIFFFCIENLHAFRQKVYSHQVLIYLDVPGIALKKTTTKYLIEQLDVFRFGVICASLLTGRIFTNKQKG